MQFIVLSGEVAQQNYGIARGNNTRETRQTATSLFIYC